MCLRVSVCPGSARRGHGCWARNSPVDEQLGTKVEWIQVASGGDALTSLAANAIDIALLGSPPTTAGIARGLPIEVIALEGVISTSERLVTRDNIRTVKDLEGKQIAYPPGSSFRIRTHRRAEGESYRRRQRQADRPRAGGHHRGVEAWRHRRRLRLEPLCKSDGRRAGGRVLLSMKDLQPHGYFVWNNFVVRREFAEKGQKLWLRF